MDAKNRKLYEKIEELKELGQDSDYKAVPVVNQLFRKQQKQEAETRAQRLEILRLIKDKKKYRIACAKFTRDCLSDEQLDRDVLFSTTADDEGVLMYVAYKGRIFQRAFKPSGEPLYDLSACEAFARSASSLTTKLKDEYTSFIKPILNT